MSSKNSAGYGNQGSFNRLRYDNCAYDRTLHESISPLTYQLYEGKFENGGKCVYKSQFYRPFDLVDVESELKNITRANSKCPENKYLPLCDKSNRCWSTVDATVPVVIHPEICPPVTSNISYNQFMTSKLGKAMLK
jgi:hypothetical protein